MLISKFDNLNIEKCIYEFEIKYNFTFPDSYKKLLNKYNGGDTPDTSFKINKISSDLLGFFGFSKARESLNYALLENMKIIEGYVSNGVIPIGMNSFGDMILIGITENNNDNIFFVYHDRKSKYILLSEKLCDFISKCKSKKIGHIRSIEERKQGMIDNGLEDEITEELISDWQKEIDKYGSMKQEKVIL